MDKFEPYANELETRVSSEYLLSSKSAGSTVSSGFTGSLTLLDFRESPDIFFRREEEKLRLIELILRDVESLTAAAVLKKYD